MKFILAALSALLFSASVSAALLTPEGSGEKIEKFTLSTAATANVEDETLKLSSVGAGLRTKKVLFVNVKVT